MKLKYVLYMAAALSLTGCNDSFLERGPQNLNDQSFWISVNDLKAYANAFYGLIPGGVSVLDDTDSDIQVPNDINSFLWDNMSCLQKVAYGKNQTGRIFVTSIIS